MSSKIDLRSVVTEHVKTLRNNRTDKISKIDLLTFYGLPFVAGIVCVWFKLVLSTKAVGILIGALSILAGLLINVLVLLFTVNSVGPTETEKAKQTKLIIEVNSNLLYAVLIAVVSIIALCIAPLIPETIYAKGRGEFLAGAAFSGFIIALIGNFVLTLLMALKRLKILLELRFIG